MRYMKFLLKRIFTSVTIMVIPHDSIGSMSLRFPIIGLLLTILFAAIGSGYTLCLAVNGLKYKEQYKVLVVKVNYYTDQFYQWNSTVAALRTAEGKFRKLFSLQTKEEVLQQADVASIGSFEIPDLAQDLKKTIENVAEIKDYLRIQKSIYVATPIGYPIPGDITSPFGNREDPISGETAFHSGIDISSSPRTPIRATADGIVSHSGWTPKGGFVVVLEHGCGFTTVYAHNEKNTVRVGGKVSRGDVIGYVGSTGKSTGPHVHYEIWKDGKSISPRNYLLRRS
jgi:murein DD-endopeptidase MepM/ murein hydrolase activator NlpD